MPCSQETSDEMRVDESVINACQALPERARVLLIVSPLALAWMGTIAAKADGFDLENLATPRVSTRPLPAPRIVR